MMQLSKPLNVAFAINDAYAKYCKVVINSLVANNPEEGFAIHIFTDRLTSETHRSLVDFVASLPGKHTVVIHEVDDSRLAGLQMSWSKFAWMRLFAGELISHDISRVLYLDCDTLVLGSVRELFEMDMTGKSVAAVPDVMTVYDSPYCRVGYPQSNGYFCSGVLVMNLDYFREHDFGRKIMDFAKENPERIQFPDQDALNAMCHDSKVTLPLKYGILDPFFRDRSFISVYKDEIQECLDDPRIVHYAGCAPWIREYAQHLFNDEFWRYAAQVPEVKKVHCCHGLSLFLLQTKIFLGNLGFRHYVKFRRPELLSRQKIVNVIQTS